MPRCKRCGAEHDVTEIVRHEHDSLVVVHCPDCMGVMGRYNAHAR